MLRSLSDIHAFYKKESFVDFCVLRNILNYFVKSQGTTGAFELTGYSIKYGLVVRHVLLQKLLALGTLCHLGKVIIFYLII